MWYFTMKREQDQRPVLQMADDEATANTSKQALQVLEPAAEFGAVFEESYNYQFSFPHVIGWALGPGDVPELLWSDGERTPKTE